MSNQYRIFYTNFGYFAQDMYDSLEAAKAAGIKNFSEFSIHKGKEMLGYWTVFGGYRNV